MRIRSTYRRQRGYVLLIMLLGLMGLGGLFASDFTQSVKDRAERDRREHNKRVLQEAKEALLQFAYNYPVTNQNGPGRLPCPDTDNDGTPNTPINCSTFVGRLPWAQPNLNLYDIRDADGQRLWYAVSTNFSTQEAGPLNSDTAGTLTIKDQEGNLIYDASIGNGVAAVILAPGAATDRNGVLQDRTVTNGIDDPFDTVADVDPGIVDPVNYLDQFFGIEDNAALGQGTQNGFIYGEVDPLGADSVLVNDQMVVITVEEVLAMAEKAVLQTYRTALQEYDQAIDADLGAGNHYPWLFNYAVNDFGGGYPELDDYPTEVNFADEILNRLDNVGRIPSIYAEYFTDIDSQPMESELEIDLNLVFPASPDTVGFSQPLGMCPSNPLVNCSSGNLEFDLAADITFNVNSSQPLTGVRFSDIAGSFGRLEGTFVADDTVSVTRYYWDEDPVPNGFQLCPAGGDDLSDCNRDGGGGPNPGGSNDTASQILRVTFTLNLAPGLVTFDSDYGVDPTLAIVARADGAGHATIQATFAGANLDAVTLPVTVTYDYDDYYLATFDVQSSGDLEVFDLVKDGTLSLGLRYYPELPGWVFTDAWYDAVQLAYAPAYSPDVFAACVEGVDCLQVNNIAGNIDNKISLLTIAGQHNWNDDGAAALADDLGDIFDLENDDIDSIFDIRAANGNDRILVIDEL